MFKYVALMALSVSVCMPVLAEEAAMPERKGPDLAQMKAHHAEMAAKRDAEIAERRNAEDSHRSACEAKVQAAASAEAMRSVMEQCHAEGKAMHEKYAAERKNKMDAMQEKRGEMKEMRGQMREKRGEMGAPAAGE